MNENMGRCGKGERRKTEIDFEMVKHHITIFFPPGFWHSIISKKSSKIRTPARFPLLKNPE